MSTKPKHLGHVNLYVRNAERSKQWYQDVLGLHVYDFRPGWAAFMSADPEKSHEVALMEVGENAALPQKGQVGLTKILTARGVVIFSRIFREGALILASW